MSYLSLINELDWMQREMSRTLGALGLGSVVDSAIYYRFPRLFLQEQPEQLVVEAHLPGIKAEDLEITIEKNILTIKGERNTCNDDEEKVYHRQERHCGRFERRIELPVEIDCEAATSSMSNGILTLTLPKAKQARPFKIAVN